MMTLAVVTTECANDFQAHVLRPLRNRYPHLECLTLRDAVQLFRSDKITCDVVVIELSSLKPDDAWHRWTGLSFFTEHPNNSPGELAKFLTDLDLAAVIVCCGDAVEEAVYQDLQDFSVHAVPTNRFDVNLINELWILRRAGLPTSQVNAYFALDHGGGKYPVPQGNFKALLALELPDPFAQASLVREACNSLQNYEIEACLEVLFLMRASRWLAQLEHEGLPYHLTFVLGTNLPSSQEMVFAIRKDLFVDMQERSLPELEDFTQLAQGTGTYIGVDAATGFIHGIYPFAVHDLQMEKIFYLPQLSARARGMVFHLPGNRTVEVYTSDGLRLQHDGFTWRRTPLAALELSLGKHKFAISFDPRRLIQTIEQLAQRRLSSIIAVDPHNFASQDIPVELEDLRLLGNLPQKPLDALGIEVLMSIFQLDGVHLVDGRGMFYKVAQNVRAVIGDSSSRSPLGTGRIAAQALSRAFPSAVVVKVSASGGRITIFKGGTVFTP